MENEGQTFAVWISSVYFVPLVGLFVRFFVRTYFKGAVAKESGSNMRKKVA